MQKENRKKFAERCFWFVLGIVINSFGISLITKASLGTSPVSSMPYVLSMEFPLSLGMFTFILNSVYIVLQAVLLRKRFKPIQLLQFAVNVLFSAAIDGSMQLLSFMQLENYGVKLAVLLLGCVILACGISIEVAPQLLYVPGEGIVHAISDVSGKNFGNIKVLFDVSLVVLAVALSFLFFRDLQGIREGTVISAFLVGRIVKRINAKVPLIRHIKSLCPAA